MRLPFTACWGDVCGDSCGACSGERECETDNKIKNEKRLKQKKTQKEKKTAKFSAKNESFCSEV
jgi:hypothetical protein